MAERKMKIHRFRIRLTGFDHVLIDESTRNIVSSVRRTGAEVRGPVPLPVRRRRYDLLRSPHKDKRSREQVEIREHCRLIDIIDIGNDVSSALVNLDLPPGVHTDIKMLDNVDNAKGS